MEIDCTLGTVGPAKQPQNQKETNFPHLVSFKDEHRFFFLGISSSKLENSPVKPRCGHLRCEQSESSFHIELPLCFAQILLYGCTNVEFLC